MLWVASSLSAYRQASKREKLSGEWTLLGSSNTIVSASWTPSMFGKPALFPYLACRSDICFAMLVPVEVELHFESIGASNAWYWFSGEIGFGWVWGLQLTLAISSGESETGRPSFHHSQLLAESDSCTTALG